jgi:hypothetical protein
MPADRSTRKPEIARPVKRPAKNVPRPSDDIALSPAIVAYAKTLTRRESGALASLSPVNKRVGIRPRLGAEQLRQLRDVGRNAPCFIARE